MCTPVAMALMRQAAQDKFGTLSGFLRPHGRETAEITHKCREISAVGHFQTGDVARPVGGQNHQWKLLGLSKA